MGFVSEKTSGTIPGTEGVWRGGRGAGGGWPGEAPGRPATPPVDSHLTCSPETWNRAHAAGRPRRLDSSIFEQACPLPATGPPSPPPSCHPVRGFLALLQPTLDLNERTTGVQTQCVIQSRN
ncbi:uncharacterized protein [Bemisia tabaci]|uniref:uncharacterized protein n=1 Tax=Bemisia tabaci TaxID=7038 RepID=UPI003B288E4D